MKRWLWLTGLALITSGCVSVPDGITPVKPFALDRYLGTWYEMARLDHSFERGMDYVTAQYQQQKDGSVKVINSGYIAKKQKWQQAEGTAWPVENNSGYFKVTFFWPFYGSYVIFWLDEDYQQAYITSYNRQYLWFLSRTPEVSEQDYQRFVDYAQQKGFKIKELIRVKQNNRPPHGPDLS